MTDFDELIGAETAGAERERLRSVHELLIEAGPPPELNRALASGPTLAMTRGRARMAAGSRRYSLPAVAAAALIALFVGISVHRHGQAVATIRLSGTPAAPHATGRLDVLAAEAGKQPMRINVHGLASGRYIVYLVLNGHPWAECGSFTVRRPNAVTTKTMNSPYHLEKNDTWVVTRPERDGHHGAIVLAPSA